MATVQVPVQVEQNTHTHKILFNYDSDLFQKIAKGRQKIAKGRTEEISLRSIIFYAAANILYKQVLTVIAIPERKC